MKLLTLNTGLLSALKGRLEPAPFVEERARALASQLLRIGADVILLQEIYEQRHRDLVAAEMQSEYPWIAYERRRRLLGLENGLMTLSRHPMSSELFLFRSAPLEETLFDSKGVLRCHIDIGSSSSLTLLNVHTTAGGVFLNPESPRADRTRERQIQQLLRTATIADPHVVIGGDLNAGPAVSESNFRSLLDAGYVSVHDCLHPSARDFTWTPANRLNASGPHQKCPPQRIDHFFVRKGDLESKRISLVSSCVCLDEEVIRPADGPAYTVSDHFGLCAELDLH